MLKFKIAYVHHDGLLSGSAISLSHLIKQLDRSRFEPIIIICSEGPVRAFFEKLNLQVICAKYKPFTTQPTPPFYNSNFYYNLFAIRNQNNIKAVLEKINPHLIHINDKSALFAGRDAFNSGYKVIWHLRSSYSGKRSYLQYLISKTIIRNHASHLIAISEDETDGFEDCENLSIINNSIDMKEADSIRAHGSTFRNEYHLSNDEIAVGMIGNIDQQKGAWNFLKAAGLAHQLCPEIKFRFFIVAPIPKDLYYGWRGKLGLINTTNAYNKAVAVTHQYNITNITHFTNRRNDMLNVMTGLDIISAVYNMEAVGRPGFEAASVGKPVIVNLGHSGKSSIVMQNHSGFCIQRENPESLAHAIITLAKNKELRETMGKNGIERARQNFDSEKNCRKIEAIYEQLIGIAD